MSSNPNVEDIKAYIRQIFEKDADRAIRVATCEGGFTYNNHNPRSTASGIFQFLDSTWIRTRNVMGLNPSLILKENWILNIETAHYLLHRSGWGQWVCK